MKNAMKKLMSLVLVAMILVSALPFAASAANTAPDGYITVDLKIDGVQQGTTDVAATAAMSYADLLTAVKGADWTAKWKLSASMNSTTQAPRDGSGNTAVTANPGEYVYLNIDTIVEPTTTPTTVPDPTTTPTTVATTVATTEAPTTKPARKDITWQIKYVEGGKVVNSGTFTPNGETAQAEDILYYHVFGRSNDWQEKYTCTKVYSSLYGVDVTYAGEVPEGDTVTYVLTPKSVSENTPSETTPEEDKNDNVENNGVVSSNGSSYNKFSGDVQLYIYANGYMNADKKISIKSGIAADGKVNLAEVKSVVRNYYNSVDTKTGIVYDGIYPQMVNWVIPYAQDEKYDTIENLYYAANNNEVVVLRVFISNVKAASSGTADSSNPKTGDELYKAVTVMAVSASALALGFYFNKKRAIQ